MANGWQNRIFASAWSARVVRDGLARSVWSAQSPDRVRVVPSGFPGDSQGTHLLRFPTRGIPSTVKRRAMYFRLVACASVSADPATDVALVVALAVLGPGVCAYADGLLSRMVSGFVPTICPRS